MYYISIRDTSGVNDMKPQIFDLSERIEEMK